MAVYAIGDLHLSLGSDKPMDVFEGWQGYLQKLKTNWEQIVGPNDTVVLAGDTSWAMRLENCDADFAFIDALPGKKKWIIKGNHDYWWNSITKMRAYLASNGLASLDFIHNSCAVADGVALCGTRSWMYEPDVAHDAKVMNRENGRLEASLLAAQNQAPEAEKVVFLHYPPVFSGQEATEVTELLRRYGVKRCYYGHLHGQSIRWAAVGEIGGICYRLISADAVGFAPVRVV